MPSRLTLSHSGGNFLLRPGSLRAEVRAINGRLGADDWLPTESVIRSARVLFLDQYGMAGNLRAALIARAAGIPIVADFEEHDDPRFKESLQEFWRNSNLVCRI